jgi:hypothetical protein
MQGSVHLCAEDYGPSCTSAENPRVQKSWNADTRSWDHKDLPYFYPPRSPDECFSPAALPRCLLYTPFCFTSLVAVLCKICHDADEAYHPTDEKLRDYSMRGGLNWAGDDTSREAILQRYRQELAERRAKYREQMKQQREREQRARELERARLQAAIVAGVTAGAPLVARGVGAALTGGASEAAVVGYKGAKVAVNIYNGADATTEVLKAGASLATEGLVDDLLDSERD